MVVELCPDSFNPYERIQEHEAQHLAVGCFGATTLFVGTMRDFNMGSDVKSLYLEHYPGMTEKQLTELATQALAQWPVEDVLLLHRTGNVEPGDTIVLISVWSAHRDVAFEACRFLIEALKEKATFWKKEILSNGEARWVVPKA